MNDDQRFSVQLTFLQAGLSIIVGLIVAIIGDVIVYQITKTNTEGEVKSGIVDALSTHLDFIDTEMSYEKALDEVYSKLTEQESTITTQSELIKDLQKKPDVSFISADLLVDGELKKGITNNIVKHNSNYYLLAKQVDDVLSGYSIKYNNDDEKIIFNSGNNDYTTESVISLTDTNVLYDGVCYGYYIPSKSDEFSMGGKHYNDGFQIIDDHSLFGNGNGYVLFNLENKYSKIEFLVGRTNITDNKVDTTLKLYLDNKYIDSYQLYGDDTPKKMSLDLNYADSMKLELIGLGSVGYGFAEVKLYY